MNFRPKIIYSILLETFPVNFVFIFISSEHYWITHKENIICFFKFAI